MHEYPYRTCAEIDLNKLQRNLQRLRSSGRTAASWRS